MGRASRRRAAAAERGKMTEEQFRGAIMRGGMPVVRRPQLPRFDQAAADAFCELGTAALHEQEAAACLGSTAPGWRNLPAPVAAMACAAGVVANRVLRAVDEQLAPEAKALGVEGSAAIPYDQLPAWVRAVLAALGQGPAPAQEGAEPAPPADEPIEVRAARSGLVIAS